MIDKKLIQATNFNTSKMFYWFFLIHFISTVSLNFLADRPYISNGASISEAEIANLRRLATVGVSLLMIYFATLLIKRRLNADRIVMYPIILYSSLALSNILGFNHAIPLNEIVSIIVISVYVLLIKNSGNVIIIIRNTLSVFAILNLISMLAIPAFVIQYGYPGYISLRLHGLARHANTLGPYIIILIWLIIYRPFKHRAQSYIMIAISIVILFVAQSKTSFVMIFVGIVVSLPYLLRRFNIKTRAALFCFGVIIGVPFVYSALENGILGALYENDEATSLTGRDIVWQATLDAWRTNQIFGYGSTSLWNSEMGNSFFIQNGWKPGYSHSLWLQFLGSAGVVGLIALIVFLWHTMTLNYVHRSKIGAFILALPLMFFLIRGISEVPIGGNFLDDNTALQYMVLAILYKIYFERTAEK